MSFASSENTSAKPSNSASGASSGTGTTTSPGRVSRVFTIQNKLGLHARPSAQIVKLANRYKAEIWVEKDGEQVNGKSIMGLMMLAASQGSQIQVIAEGPDAEAAMDEIGQLIHARFGED